MYEVGDKIIYRGSYGSGREEKATIEAIGEHKSRRIYDLNNGHWCYEEQIVEKDN